MTDALRVRQLRVVAPRAAAAGLAARVEDALRTASRPPALAHAFLLVRRLHLRVPRDTSGQGIALQLEREWARLLAQAVPLEDADDAAEVVWAASEGAARQALLQRWLRDERPRAWCWQCLAPQAAADAPLPDRLAALLAAPWQDAADAAGAPRWWRQALPPIEAAGHAEAVLARLPVALRLRIAVAWQAPPRAWAAVAAGRPAAGAAATTADVELRPSLPGERGTAGGGPRRGDPPASAAPPRPAGGRAVPPAPAPAAAATPASRPAPLAPAPFGHPPAPASATPGPATAPAPRRRTAGPTLHGLSTAWAGLWFLLPLLQRAGFAPDAAGPLDAASRRWAATWALLLQQAARRHAVAHPVSQWIDALAEVHLAALAPGEPAAGAGQAALQAEAAGWLRQARIACLRQTRLPLRRLLHRPGEALLAPHRWDIVLPLQALDVRIRRAGLDIDPGHVPWLDVVVRFHYR